MRALLALLAVFIAVQLLTAQGRVPPELYHGPLYVSREATYIEPTSGAPLEFSNSYLGVAYVLETTVHSKSLRSIAASAITIRLAFGPATHGMITFRMRAADRAPAPPLRITPESRPALLLFRILPDDPYPGVLALKPHMKVVFTVERIEGDNRVPVFENPDATELLWEALGRPSPSQR